MLEGVVISSKGGQTGTLAESVPVCPPWPKNVPDCPPEGQTGTISSQIALLGRANWDGRPRLPFWRAIWGRPPALGKKEGGKQIWSPEGQSGTASRTRKEGGGEAKFGLQKGNLGRPPALGKKEGGKQIWSQGGQYGTLLTKIVPRWRIFSAILNLFFCLIAGKRGCGLRLFHSDFRLVF